ncbi:MAG: BspA family leucine-rich repeat surface protein, partial [bacterium]|nr:BspA family leucine-rich repeat surface protein [bacterium]
MKKQKRTKRMKSRLLAGIFCLSLLFADLASAAPVWAQEEVMPQAEQSVQEEQGSDLKNGAEEIEDSGSKEQTEKESGSDEMSDEDGTQGPAEGDVQNPGEEESAGEMSDSETEPGSGGDKTSEDAQKPDESDREDGADDADDAENVEEDTENAEDTERSEDAEDAGGAEDIEEADSVSGNDMAEDSVSIMSLLAASDNIDSGTYENITWVVDADGKLTVEGTGEFAASGNKKPAGYNKRGPWTQKFNTYYAIKSAEIKVTGIKDVSGMFNGCSNLISVSFAGSDLSMLEDMSEMFYGCNKLESVDFGEKLDTGNVTDMSYMFSGCNKLESIDFGEKFDTKNVTDMSYMFRSCYVLKKIGLDSFDTKNVTNMQGMFYHCGNFEELNLSGWDTAKVTDMSALFRDCGFDKITLGGRFTTKNVTDMSNMFAGDRKTGQTYHVLSDARWNLNGLDLAWLDLSSIKVDSSFFMGKSGDAVYCIFGGCNVGGLDLSRLDTTKTTTLPGLFAGCDMTGVDFSDLRTDTITDMRYMFEGCKGTIDLHTLHTENVINMAGMFSGTTMSAGYLKEPGFTSIDLNGFNTENVRCMGEMFYGQTKLKTLDVSSLNTKNVTSMGGMFIGCTSLESIDLSSLDMGSVTDMQDMFANCPSLTEVYLGNLGSAQLEMDEVEQEEELYAAPVYGMFRGCTSLKSVDLSGFDFGHLTNANGIFWDCTSLTTIRTPYNVAFDYTLPDGTWYMADGTTTTILPKNLSYSVLLQKDKKPEATEARLEVSKRKTVYACGESVNTDDLTVMYYGTDGSAKKLAAGEYTISPTSIDTSEPGEKTLTVTYTPSGGTPLTVEIKLRVTLLLTAENVGITLPQAQYPYTAAEQKPVPAVTLQKAGADACELAAEEDYEVSYRNNIHAGDTAEVIITGKGVYSGSVSKAFTITPAPLTITAEDMTIGAGEELRPEEYPYTATLLGRDRLTKEPSFTFTWNGTAADGEQNAQADGVPVDTSRLGSYTVTPKDAAAGSDYGEITYVPGTLTVSEERVVYTVRFDLMGHGTDFTKGGVRAGSLLELTEEERTPEAAGYLFAGWYKDKGFAAKSAWDFGTDTVQGDMTLYACWLTDGTGNGGTEGGLKLFVQEIPDLAYTGSAQKPAVTVYDSDKKTLLKAGKDYTVKYANN